jgi:hypothetical protein
LIALTDGVEGKKSRQQSKKSVARMASKAESGMQREE